MEAPAEFAPAQPRRASAPLTSSSSVSEPIDVPAPERQQTETAQLVRSAELSLEVESVPATLRAIDSILSQAGGDLLEMNHDTPARADMRPTAWLRLRVPQEQLDAAIVKLHALGEVQHQSMTAEDVLAQLVDYEARLTNLRKAEATVLKIMERSGKVTDVLEVARELSRIRESIERIAAQRANLATRVAYSTIHLNLESAATIASPSPDNHLRQAWQRSTHSVSQFSLQLVGKGIWAIAYSPYVLAIALCGYGIRAKLRR